MKRIISFIICFIMLMSFAACGSNDYIGIDKAKQTVVDDIGAAIDEVKFAVNDLITDDNGDYYKLHFTNDGTEYIYKVDAMTGEIIDKSSAFNDTDDNSDSTTTSQGEMASQNSSENTDELLENNDMSNSSASTTSM